MTLKSPYPYFGGKATVAAELWKRFGDAPNFVDPFFGSGAVLLARPHAPDLELVNDLDGYVSNFWRAVQADAETVAAYADYPAFENDLHARHSWLVQRKDRLRERLEGDPDWYDAKIAGWWVWGMSLWIGSGFCSGKGRWQSVDGKLVQADPPLSGVARQLPKAVDRSLRAEFVEDYATGAAIARQLPHLSTSGQGVSSVALVRRVPRLTAWQGIHSLAATDTAVSRKRLHVMSEKGVKRNRLELSGEPKGVHRKFPEVVSARGDAARRATSGIYSYFDALQERFRRVRVTCGDWTRVVSPAVLGAKTPCAVLLDPPYNHAGRETGLYNHDSADVYAASRDWALANGDNPALRIAYCGYEDGFEFPAGWEKLTWKANGGYSNQGEGRRENAFKETIWFSPFCLKVERQLALFAESEGLP